jgi:hypothetical protein
VVVAKREDDARESVYKYSRALALDIAVGGPVGEVSRRFPDLITRPNWGVSRTGRRDFTGSFTGFPIISRFQIADAYRIPYYLILFLSLSDSN